MDISCTMNGLSDFVVIIICCIALLSLLLLSTTEVSYSQLPYFPHNQQLSNNHEVNATVKNQYRGQMGSSNIMERESRITNAPKVAILTFGDGWKAIFNAKPILDKYGFKAKFFVTCDRVGRPARMTWQDLVTLYNEGHDIESKTMTAPILTNVSADQLNFEVGQSKRCLLNHGMNATVFATPHGKGSDNATVVKAISKYYDFAINGFSNLMFLHCDGWKMFLQPN